MSDDEREEKELDLSSAEVVTKYKTAAEIVNSLFLTLLMPLWSQILFGFWLFHTLDTIFPGTLLKFIFFNLYFLVLLRFDVFFFLCKKQGGLDRSATNTGLCGGPYTGRAGPLTHP